GLSMEYGTETTAFLVSGETRGGIWYAWTLRGVAFPRPVVPDVDALRYSVETRIRKNLRIEGTTTISFRVLRDQGRLFRLHIFPKLRIRSATLLGVEGAEEPLSVIQGKEDEDGDAALVFPRPFDGGAEASVRITYEGNDILDDSGGGTYVVSARRSWYPNFGTFSDLASFDLVYRVPKANLVVSVGQLVDRKEADGEVTLTFRAVNPIRVAGFNYGAFGMVEKTDEATGFHLRVFSDRDGQYFVVEESEGAVGRIDPKRQAESVLVDAMNAAKVGTAYFGPLSDPVVSISQQAQWGFGQSWPGLIFLPYSAFVSSTQRAQLGMIRSGDFVNNVGFHELAHQWWGHHVGWATYRDEWLSEGFAEFTAGLT
ncbi:hypothetical protein EG835_12840, partial [bacterium]|nr:hypothetical protein [bacterium]